MPCFIQRRTLRLPDFTSIMTNLKVWNQLIKKFRFLKDLLIIKILKFLRKKAGIKVKLRVYRKWKKISCLLLPSMPLKIRYILVAMRASVRTSRKRLSITKWNRNGYGLLSMMKLSSLVIIMKHRRRGLILLKLLINNSLLLEFLRLNLAKSFNLMHESKSHNFPN